jgi:hypothetical protein
MTRDFTLQDLAGEASEEAAEAAAETAAETATEAASEAADAEGGDTAKWLVELYSEMKDDGTLQAILFGPEGAEQLKQQQQPQQMNPDTPTDMDPTEAIDAETIANVGELVIDEIGDVPLSTVVTACKERPATINQVIEAKGDEIFGEQADAEPAAAVEADRDDDRDDEEEKANA